MSNILKVNIKGPEQCLVLLFLTYFTHYYIVIIAELEQIKAGGNYSFSNKFVFSNCVMYNVLCSEKIKFLGYMFPSSFTQHKIRKG